MSKLSHSTCVSSLIDQINKDLSDKLSSNNSKCDHFTSDLLINTIYDASSKDLPKNDTFSIVNPLINDFTIDQTSNYTDHSNETFRLDSAEDNFNDIKMIDAHSSTNDSIRPLEKKLSMVHSNPVSSEAENNPISIDKLNFESDSMVVQINPSISSVAAVEQQQLTAERNELLNKKKILNGQQKVCQSEKNNCKCHCVPRYSRSIHELPSLETVLKQYCRQRDHSYSATGQSRFQSILHLIESTKEQSIAQTNIAKKQIELTTPQSTDKDQSTRIVHFDEVVEDQMGALILNYSNLSRSVLPDLIQSCLNGNDALLIQARSSDSRNTLVGPKGLLPFSISWLFDGLEQLHRKFLVRCTAVQVESEQLIDLFAKHKLSRTPSSRSLREKSILNGLSEIRCLNRKRLAQATELAINNNRKLIDLTSSNENVLLITYHIYQYDIKKFVPDNRKTGGCSRFHLLDVESSVESYALLSSVLNDILNTSQFKLSLQKQNKIWPKRFDDETNKIVDLFQEFVNNPSCFISLIGSYENKQSNVKSLNAFCDLSEQIQKTKKTTLNKFTAKKDKSSEQLMNKRKNGIKYQQSVKSANHVKNLRFNCSNSLPRRLSCKYGIINDECKENVKKVILKRQHLRIGQTAEQWIDGPNCKLTDESDCFSVHNSSVHNLSASTFIASASNSPLKRPSISRTNAELVPNQDLIKQKRIQNWVTQQQMSGKSVDHRAASEQMMNFINSNSIANSTSSNLKIDESILDKYITLNSQLSNLYTTINRRSNSRMNDQNENTLVTNLNKESPFKFLSGTNSLNRRAPRNCVLNKLNLKTNYQEQFKLTSSSESDWSSGGGEEEESEQKLIEENLNFFSTNFFRQNLQLSSATLSDDDKSTHQADMNKRTKRDERTIDLELVKCDKKDDDKNDGFELTTEPPKQLKLEQFLKHLINSTTTSESELNNLPDGVKSVRHSGVQKMAMKQCSVKTAKSNTSSSTSSSGVHLSSSLNQASSNEANKPNFDTFNSKMDLNSNKSSAGSYAYKNEHKSSTTSSGYCETESGVNQDKFIGKKITLNFDHSSSTQNQSKCATMKDDKKVSTCRIITLEPKSSFKCTSHEFTDTELNVVTKSNSRSAIVCKPVKETKSQKLFCCGLI